MNSNKAKHARMRTVPLKYLVRETQYIFSVTKLNNSSQESSTKTTESSPSTQESPTINIDIDKPSSSEKESVVDSSSNYSSQDDSVFSSTQDSSPDSICDTEITFSSSNHSIVELLLSDSPSVDECYYRQTSGNVFQPCYPHHDVFFPADNSLWNAQLSWHNLNKN